MGFLDSSDFTLLNKIIKDLYDTEHTLAAKISNFLDALPALMSYDRAAILFFYRGNDGSYMHHSSFNTNWEHIEVPLQNYYNYYFNLDDTIPVFDHPSSIIFRSSDFFNQKHRRETEYWQNYLEPNDCIFSLEGNLSLKNAHGLMGGFCFFRGIAGNDFSKRDMIITSCLQSHLSNVLEHYGNNA